MLEKVQKLNPDQYIGTLFRPLSHESSDDPSSLSGGPLEGPTPMLGTSGPAAPPGTEASMAQDTMHDLFLCRTTFTFES